MFNAPIFIETVQSISNTQPKSSMEQTSINVRVALLIKELRLNNAKLAKSIDKVPSTINAIVDGKTRPSFDLLETIFTVYPQVSRDWLLMGEGPMFRVQPDSTPVDQRPDQYLLDQLARIEQGHARELAIKNEQIKDLSEYVRILLGKSEGTPFAQDGIPFFEGLKQSGVYALPFQG